MIISEREIEEGRGKGKFQLRLLSEFGRHTNFLTPEKIRDFWAEISKHDVLFNDETHGNVKFFLDLLADPRSMWLEILDVEKEKPVGLMYVTRIIIGYDLEAHFAVFDGVAKGREVLFEDAIRFTFLRYNVRRISVEVPIYQGGVVRHIENLGFANEGRRKERVVYKQKWFDTLMFGLLRTEFLEEEIEDNGRHTIREREERNSGRDETVDAGHRGHVSATPTG